MPGKVELLPPPQPSINKRREETATKPIELMLADFAAQHILNLLRLRLISLLLLNNSTPPSVPYTCPGKRHLS
jgi:hypothetical protein